MPRVKRPIAYQDELATIYNASSLRMPELADGSVDLIFTDPPYDIPAIILRKHWRECARVIKPGGHLFWKWGTARLSAIGHTSIPEFTEVRAVCWEKPFSPQFWNFAWPFHWEVIEWWVRGPDRKGLGRYQFEERDVISRRTLQKEDTEYCKHPHQMPMSIPAAFLRWFAEPDDVILDPFSGSGTTCYTAKALGFKSIGYEINPEHCETIRRRFEQQVLDLREERRADADDTAALPSQATLLQV